MSLLAPQAPPRARTPTPPRRWSPTSRAPSARPRMPSPTSRSPTGREEEWRFTPVDRLGGLFRDEATGACLVPWSETLPDGVSARHGIRTSEWRRQRRPGARRPGRRRRRRRHRVASPCSTLPADAELDEPGAHPAHRHRARARATATCVVDAGRFAQGHGRARARAAPPTTAQLLSVRGRRRCRPDLRHRAGVGRRRPPPRPARRCSSVATRAVRHIAVTLGGELVRISTPTPATPVPAARSRASASTSPTPGSTRSTGCSSTTRRRTATRNVEYKGALQGDTAHTVWVGDVLIRASAEGTDTYELNRNLVLTEGARADSVPNLEIETGEIVGAGHASRDRPVRRRAAVLPAGARHPRGRAPAASSCAASSPASSAGSASPRCRSTSWPPSTPSSATPRRERHRDADVSAAPELVHRRPSSCGSAASTSCPTVGAAAGRHRRPPGRDRAHRRRRACTRSTTPAATPTSRCPRASSTAAPSSAGCTARASTSAPGSRPARRPSSPSPSTPCGSRATTSLDPP